MTSSLLNHLSALIGLLGNYTGKLLVRLLYEETSDGTRVRVRDTYVDIGEAFRLDNEFDF